MSGSEAAVFYDGCRPPGQLRLYHIGPKSATIIFFFGRRNRHFSPNFSSENTALPGWLFFWPSLYTVPHKSAKAGTSSRCSRPVHFSGKRLSLLQRYWINCIEALEILRFQGFYSAFGPCYGFLMLSPSRRDTAARTIRSTKVDMNDPDAVTIEPTSVAIKDVGISMVLVIAKFIA